MIVLPANSLPFRSGIYAPSTRACGDTPLADRIHYFADKIDGLELFVEVDENDVRRTIYVYKVPHDKSQRHKSHWIMPNRLLPQSDTSFVLDDVPYTRCEPERPRIFLASASLSCGQRCPPLPSRADRGGRGSAGR